MCGEFLESETDGGENTNQAATAADASGNLE